MVVEEGAAAEGVDRRSEKKKEHVEPKQRQENRRDRPAEEEPAARGARLGAVGGPTDREARGVDREDEDRRQEEDGLSLIHI